MSTKTNARLIATLAIVLAPWFLAMPASAIEIADESLCSTDTINPVPPPCPPYRVITVGALNSFDIGFVDSNSHTYALAARKLSFTSTAAGTAANPAIVVVDTNTLTVVARLGSGLTSTPGPNFTPFAGLCFGGYSGPNLSRSREGSWNSGRVMRSFSQGAASPAASMTELAKRPPSLVTC